MIVSEAYSRALRALHDPTVVGLCLVDAGGFGLSAVAASILERSGIDARITVIGNRALADSNYAAIAPYLHGLDPRATPDPLAVLHAFRRGLAEINPGGPVAIVVEQLGDLDPASVAVLAQMSTDPSVRLIVPCRFTGQLPAELRGLLTEGLLVAIPVATLGHDEVGELSRARLGGSVAWATADALLEASGANPEILERVIETAVAEGVLRRVDGVWLLQGPPGLDPETVLELTRLMRELSAEEREALAAVALAYAVPEALLRERFTPAAVSALRRAELLVDAALPEAPRAPGSRSPVGAPAEEPAEEPAPDPHLRLRPGILAEHLRSLVSPARSRSLWGRLYGALPMPRSTPAILRYVLWPLECGAPVDERALLTLARLANHINQPDLVLRAVARSEGGPHRPELELERARAYFTIGDIGTARVAMSRLLGSHMAPDTGMSAVEFAAQLFYTSGTGGDLLAQTLGRWETATLEEGSELQRGHARQAAILLRPVTLAMAGDYLGSAAMISEGAAAIVLGEPEERMIASLVSGEVVAALGDLPAGAAIMREAVDLAIADPELANYGEFGFTRLAVTMAYALQWDEIDALLEDIAEDNRRWLRSQGAVVEFLAAQRALQGGDLDLAAERCHVGVVMLRERDAKLLRPLLLGCAAFLAALAGDHERAGEYVAEYDSLDYAAAPFFDTLARAQIAFGRASEGDPAPRRAVLRAELESARGAGRAAIAQFILHLLILLEDPGAPAELLAATEGSRVLPASILHAWARAIEGGEAEPYVAAAEAALEGASELLAASALSGAFLRLRAAPDRAVHRRAIAALGRLSPAAAALDPQLMGVRARAELTPRESEVAALIILGQTSRDIARTLQLSDRTVDGHVARLLGKLGLARRGELPHALPTPPSS